MAASVAGTDFRVREFNSRGFLGLNPMSYPFTRRKSRFFPGKTATLSATRHDLLAADHGHHFVVPYLIEYEADYS